MNALYNLKNNQDCEETKQVIKTEITGKRSLEAKDSGYSETGNANLVGGTNLVTSSAENAPTSLNIDRRTSVSSVSSLQNTGRVIGQLPQLSTPTNLIQSQLTSPAGINYNNNNLQGCLLMNGVYGSSINNGIQSSRTTVHTNEVQISELQTNPILTNAIQINDSIPTASSTLSSTIILAEPDKHQLQNLDKKSQQNCFFLPKDLL